MIQFLPVEQLFIVAVRILFNFNKVFGIAKLIRCVLLNIENVKGVLIIDIGVN